MPKSKQGTWFFIGAYVLAVLLPLSAPAQTNPGLDLDRLSPSQRAATVLTPLLSAEPLPNSDVVDPRTYLVGPGDVVSYSMTGLDYSEKLTIITPENTIVIDRLGTVSCLGLTLAQLRDTLVSSLRRRSPNVELSISLRRPRYIYASLSGNAQYPGTYVVPASMRVSTFLAVTRQPGLLGKNSDQRDPQSNLQRSTTEGVRASAPPLSAFALRNIIVRHRSGITVADLAQSAIPGYEYFDPHLREGDEVIIPFDQSDYPSVTIAGAVGNPVSLAYREGDRASILISASGGPTSDADLSSVTLVDGNGSGRTTLSLDSNWQLKGEDPLLAPGSTIVVERKVRSGQNSLQGVVEVQGEVERTGTQVITPGVTKLRDVIARAGGLKKDAALSLASVMRASGGPTTMRAAREATLRSFLYSNLTLEDTLRYFLDQQFRLPYVSCDFIKAFADSTSSDNIRLQNGDVINIPKQPDRIYVYGQVNQPGFVNYVPGHNLDWYVDAAGGYALGSKSGRTTIIRGKTRVAVDDNEAIVQAGDEVYVPRKPDVPAGTELQMYAVIAGILGSLVAIVATTISILR